MRRAVDGDEAGILDLTRATLGWESDERHAALFRWKHDDNPFGPSPRWVAEVEDRIVALRVLMRWQFERPDGSIVGAVRAVDTATHPDLQGRGLFRRLTLLAVDELTADGTRFVFNTPNDQSRPGYLKMGWQSLGRAPVIVAPRRGRSLARLVRARAPAERWSAPCEAGRPAIDALADPHMASLLSVQDVDRRRTRTARTAAYLSWRYTQGPIEYRALGTGDPDQGLVVFRLRRRGPALEAVIAELLVRPGDHRTAVRLVRSVLRSTHADYALLVTHDWRHVVTVPAIPVPRIGPIVTWRALAERTAPSLDGWELSLGDLELF